MSDRRRSQGTAAGPAALAAIGLAMAAPSAGHAELVVSANDGKQIKPGEPPASRTADSLALFELGAGGLRPIGSLNLPASMIGPPESVALTPDRRLALVTASQKLDGASPPALVPDDSLSLVDLADPIAPRLIETVQAGAGASGVAVNRAGTLALVANAADDSVSIFAIAGRRLIAAGSVRLDPKSRPVAVKFTPDGRSALVVAQALGAIVPLAIRGRTARRDGPAIAVGPAPYSIAIDRAGRFAYVTNLRGRPPVDPAAPPAPPPPGTVTSIDVAGRRVAGSVEAGVTPEHVALSPSGRYLEVTLINGSNADPAAANYRDHGIVRIFAVRGGSLAPLAEARTGRWCQGAAWSADERRVLLQCADARQIEVYRFDGRTLVADPAGGITLDARPGTLVTAPDG